MLKGETFTIQGSEKITTKGKNLSVVIDTGRVYVYIVPNKDGQNGRRIFLTECKSGDFIPFLYTRSEAMEHDDIRDWYFVIVPLEKTTVHIIDCTDSHKATFINNAKINNISVQNFDEDLVEFYRMNSMRDMVNIFASGRQTENARINSFRIMLEQLRGKGKICEIEFSTNKLYNSVATICNSLGIDIVSFDILTSVCGNHFEIEDIARLSGFPIREVVLTDDWYKSDAGPLLVYVDEKNNPMVALPKALKGYKLYDPETGVSTVITREISKHIMPQAVTVYRPLPAASLNFKDVVRYGIKEIRPADVAIMLILAFVGAIIGLLIPIMNEKIFDEFIPLGDESGLAGLCMVIISCMLGNVGFSMVRNLSAFRNNTRMRNAIQAAMYDRVFNMPNSNLRQFETADLIQRVMSVSQLFGTITEVVTTQGLTIVLSLIYLVKMWDYSPELSKAGIFMTLITVIIMILLTLSGLRASRSQMDEDGKISSMLYQFLGGIAKIRMAGAEERALNQYIAHYSKSIGYTRSLRRKTNGVTIFGDAAQTAYSIVIFYLVVRQAVDVTPGQFMGFNTAFSSFSSAILSLSTAIMSVEILLPVIDRIKVVLESIPETDTELSMPGEITGDIELNNVSFSYDPNGPVVLKDINLHIHPGEYIGIVGSSGCGKSTLMKLLLGFEKPTEGKIYYDGQDIDDMNKRQLRKKFGVVLQNGALLPESIYENIKITAPNATLSDVETALDTVGLKDDVDAMPMGLHTVLSEGSGQISGGQKQRILIARAIINRPKILFFDEATSALDNITQAHVADSLANLKSTRIVIAHRLSTIMKCDRILVMDNGRIVEEGTFDKLIELGGIFADFSKRQM